MYLTFLLCVAYCKISNALISYLYVQKLILCYTYINVLFPDSNFIGRCDCHYFPCICGIFLSQQCPWFTDTEFSSAWDTSNQTDMYRIHYWWVTTIAGTNLCGAIIWATAVSVFLIFWRYVQNHFWWTGRKNTKKGFKDSKDLTIVHVPRNFSSNHKKTNFKCGSKFMFCLIFYLSMLFSFSFLKNKLRIKALTKLKFYNRTLNRALLLWYCIINHRVVWVGNVLKDCLLPAPKIISTVNFTLQLPECFSNVLLLTCSYY